MILFFHFLCLLARYIVSNLSKSISKSKPHSADGCENDPADSESSPFVLFKETCFKHPTYENGTLKFFPPVYVQRYETVTLILEDDQWKGKIRKVADFGCAELGLFMYLKNIEGINEILEIDIDKEKLNRYSYKATPLSTDYLWCRATKPLEVYILAGSIADYDDCLTGTDAVIGIELIEHLSKDAFIKMPHNVFNQIKPKLAIFTTPNADFNSLFPGFQQFRHPDHKFEWTRKEFYNWTQEIIKEYPNYSVRFYGIGAGPEGTENLGCCTQMAVFQKSEDSDYFSSAREKPGKIENYELIKHHSYPVRVDTRTREEKIFHEIQHQISYINTLPNYYNYDENQCEIPLSLIQSLVIDLCPDEVELMNILKDSGIKLKCVNGSYFVIHTTSDYGSSEESLVDENSPVNETVENQDGVFYVDENWDMEEELCLDDLANFQSARSLENFEGESTHRGDNSRTDKLDITVKDDAVSGSLSCNTLTKRFDLQSRVLGTTKSKIIEEKRGFVKSKIPRKKALRETDECSPRCKQRTSASYVRKPFGKISKSCSLDSCLENLNCTQFESDRTLYLNLIPGGSGPLRKGSSSSSSKSNFISGSSLFSSSFDKAVDSGYPISFSSPGADLTPEQVDDLFTENEMTRSSSSSSEGGVVDVPNQRIIHDVFVEDMAVENGDLANNNRDGEGNNVEG